MRTHSYACRGRRDPRPIPGQGGIGRRVDVLLTSIGVPRVDEKAIPRDRLLSALQSGLSRRCIAIGAEAGYGKTTLTAHLVTEPDLRRTELYRLRTLGAYVDGDIRGAETFPAPPEIDRAYWKAAAAANTANADLNGAAGEYLLDSGLRYKPDSLYTAREFARLLDYLATGRWAERWRAERRRGPAGFAGVVYVTGEVTLIAGRRVRISDGTLVAEDSVMVADRAGLQITHTAATRALPGLIVLDPGRLAVGRRATLDVHGLVYAGRVFDAIYGAQVQIVGSVIGADPVISVNNLAATVVIRYYPAVLGTPGLRVPDGSPVVAWVAAWEERP